MTDLDLLDSAFAQRLVTLPGGAVVAVRECGPAAHNSHKPALPPVVLLHGIGSGAASWLHTAVALSEYTRVIAWDAPGYGDSTPLPMAAPWDVDYAARLGELLTALHLPPCVLVGHSLGALMAMAYSHTAGVAVPETDVVTGKIKGTACREVGAVLALVLISPAQGYGVLAGTPEAAQRVQREKAQQVRASRLDALAKLGIDGMAAAMPDRLLSPAASPAARAWVSWNASRLHPAGYAQAVEMLCQSRLGQCSEPSTARSRYMPLEVHVGDADVVTPPAACDDWARTQRVPCSRIAQAGHASPIEQALAVSRLISIPTLGMFAINSLLS